MNLFLKLPIYERLVLLKYVPDHDLFYTLLSMPEFGFLTKNPKLQARLYKSRLNIHFSQYESFYEENIPWKEIYDRILNLEIDIFEKTEFCLVFDASFYARDGYLMQLKILLSKGILPDGITANVACDYGQVHVLQWMKENNLEMPDQYAVNRAALNGHLNVLKWLKENKLLLPDQAGANCAAYKGHIHILEWMKDNKLPIPNQQGAIRSGKVEILNWLKGHNLLLLDQSGANQAAAQGHINILEWIKENNLPLPDQEGTKSAATHGLIISLKWIKKNCKNISWNEIKKHTSYQNVLQWLDEQ